MKRTMIFLIAVILTPTMVLAGAKKPKEDKDMGIDVPNFNMSAKDIHRSCDKMLKTFKKGTDRVAKTKEEPTFKNTLAALDEVMATMGRDSSNLWFLGYTATDEKVRKAGLACEEKLEKLSIKTYAREDLYARVKAFSETNEAKMLKGQEKRLLDGMMRSFKSNGLTLASEADKKRMLEINQRLTELQIEFSKNIRDAKDHLVVSKADLEGLPESYVKRLKRTEDGGYIVTVAYPDYFPFQDKSKSAEARKKLSIVYNSVAKDENLPILKEVLTLRHEAAKLLGYSNHAESVLSLSGRMAREPKEVKTFLDGLSTKLRPKLVADMNSMRKLKCAEMKSCSGDQWKKLNVEYWEYRYYRDQLVQRDHQIDHEKIREYFPLKTVTDGMFEIYQTLLDVTYKEIPGAYVWHDSVKLFEVKNKKDGKLIGYFYMDLFPREGKYQHAAAFPMRSGYLWSTGEYQKPVSAMVANFNAPADGKPALLSHDEVETYFHEFGHIMHQVLTTAKYSSHSGTSVARDFVEAPSQMLENWVWTASSLQKLSGHYKTGEKLPNKILKRLLAAKDVMGGIKWMRQVFYASVDLAYHMSDGKLDTTKKWDELQTSMMKFPLTGGVPEARFGHLMGYDAGYYGYLWSKVYAQDMFTRFEKKGVMSTDVGHDYRKWILEPGGSMDPNELIENFLGRKPNQAAFLRSLGLKARM